MPEDPGELSGEATAGMDFIAACGFGEGQLFCQDVGTEGDDSQTGAFHAADEVGDVQAGDREVDEQTAVFFVFGAGLDIIRLSGDVHLSAELRCGSGDAADEHQVCGEQQPDLGGSGV